MIVSSNTKVLELDQLDIWLQEINAKYEKCLPIKDINEEVITSIFDVMITFFEE
jgi:hypothetical protein